MGLFVSYFLPLVSMISPVINGLAVQLRDALDVFRKKAQTTDIQFTKLQNMYGLSVIQMVMGTLLSTYGVLIYIQVPQALMNGDMSIALTYLMLMYLTCSMASCLLVKYSIPVLQFVILEAYFYFRRFICCNKRPLLHRPLLYKNIDIHKDRNQKIGLTFIVVVAFMM